jgi:ankyrin repeat protein
MSLEDACWRNDANLAKEIIANNSNILDHNFNNDGFSPIHIAAFMGSVDVLHVLLNAKPSLIDGQDAWGNIPLSHVFLGIHHLKHVLNEPTVLKKAKHNVNLINAVQQDMFHNYKETIATLVLRGANLSLRNNSGKRWNDFQCNDEKFKKYVYCLSKGLPYLF